MKLILTAIISLYSLYWIATYEPEYELIDYDEFYALVNGHEADRQFARALLLHAWRDPDVEKQCTEHYMALYLVLDMYMPVDCEARKRYFDLPPSMRVQYAQNVIP